MGRWDDYEWDNRRERGETIIPYDREHYEELRLQGRKVRNTERLFRLMAYAEYAIDVKRGLIRDPDARKRVEKMKAFADKVLDDPSATGDERRLAGTILREEQIMRETPWEDEQR